VSRLAVAIGSPAFERRYGRRSATSAPTLV